MFWFGGATGEQSPIESPWLWQETKIELQADVPASLLAIMTSFNTPPRLPPTIAQSLNSSSLPASKHITKTLRPSRKSFMDELRNMKDNSTKLVVSPGVTTVSTAQPSISTSSTVSRTQTTFATRRTVSLSPQLERAEDSLATKITCLCSKISSSQGDASYGCLKGDVCQFLVHPVATTSRTQDHVTLERILSTTSAIRLNRRQRLEVALILAASHIQLHPIP